MVILINQMIHLLVDADDTYFDGVPFLWKDFERMGYLSWLSEDYPLYGMFQYLRKGLFTF